MNVCQSQMYMLRSIVKCWVNMSVINSCRSYEDGEMDDADKQFVVGIIIKIEKL